MTPKKKKTASDLDVAQQDEYVYDDNLSVAVIEPAKDDQKKLQHYFGCLLRSDQEIDKRHKYCALCLKDHTIKRYKNSTSSGNLRSHIIEKHGIHFENKSINKNQRKVTDMLLSVSKGTSSIQTVNAMDRRFVLARQLCLWFCRDLLPFNEVNKQGLHDFAVFSGIIKHDEKLPHRTTLADTALNDIYSALFAYIKKFVRANLPKTIPMSMDFWSDNVNRVSYINYWIHWIDSDFRLQKLCLGLKRFPHPHTGKIIANEFNRTVESFKLEDKIFLGVTDSGSNITLACKLAGIEREPCMCHNFHLLVAVDLIKNHKEMQPVRDLVVRMKKINKALIFRYEDLKSISDKEYNNRLYHIVSTAKDISEALEATEVAISDFDDTEEDDIQLLTGFCSDQVRRSTNYKTIKNSNATRWNSVLSMSNSFIENFDTINHCLASMKNFDLLLSDDDLTLALDFVRILKVFEKATDLLQGESYPSLNLAVFCYLDIKTTLTEILAENPITDIIKTAASFLLERLDKRFIITENMIVATFLDPSMHEVRLIRQYCDAHEVDMVELLIKKWHQYEPDFLTKPTTNLLQKKKPAAIKLRMELIHKHVATELFEEDSVEGSFHREYLKYSAVVDAVDDPLAWWKAHKDALPYLSALARVILAIPGSSGATETHFSESGSLITKKKAR